MHVAASLFHDVAPARDLGLKIVWINRLGEDADPKPDRELPDLSGLPDTLDELVQIPHDARPPEDDDFDAILELTNAHQLAAFGEADVTEDELRTWLTTPYVVVERDIRLLEDDGRLVGYVDVDPNKDDPPLWWCDLKVAPDVDAEVVVAELVGWLDERAHAGTLRVWTSATDDRVIGALEQLDFAPARPPTGWRSTSTATSKSRSGPTDLGSHPHRRRGATCVRRVLRGLAGHLGSIRRDLRGVGPLAHEGGDLRAVPPVSRAGGRGAGGVLRLLQDLNDSSAGHVESLGVRRSWRKQGFGLALLLHSFQALRQRGWMRGTLGSMPPALRAPPGCTSGPGCVSTETRSSSSGRDVTRLPPW